MAGKRGRRPLPGARWRQYCPVRGARLTRLRAGPLLPLLLAAAATVAPHGRSPRGRSPPVAAASTAAARRGRSPAAAVAVAAVVAGRRGPGGRCILGGARPQQAHEELAARRRRRRALPAAPGFLVLGLGAAARLRIPPDRALLPRGLLARRGRADVGAGALRLARAPRGAGRGGVGRCGEAACRRGRGAHDSRAGRLPVPGRRPLHRHLRVPASGRRRRRGLLPRQPVARPVRLPAVAVRHQHDGVHHPRIRGPRVRQRGGDVRADGIVVGAPHSGHALPVRNAGLGPRQAPRLHDARPDVPRPVGVRAHRDGDLRHPGDAARALHRHRGDGWRHDAERGERGRRAVLVRRADRRRGGDELRLLRGDARHGLGQHLPDRAVPDVRGRRHHLHRREHRRVPGGDGAARGLPRVGAAPDAGADLAAVLLQLHADSAVVDHVPPHLDLLPHGAPDGAVPEDGHLLPALHPGHLAALHVPGAGRQRDDRRAGHRVEARGARGARGGRRRADAGGDGGAAAGGGRRRRDHPDAGALRAALAGGSARRGHHGRGHGQRLADPGPVDDVHGGRLRLLRGEVALRPGGAGADGAAVRGADRARGLFDRAPGAAGHLRHRRAVRLLRLHDAPAAPRGGPLLAGEHEVGRIVGRALDGGGR